MTNHIEEMMRTAGLKPMWIAREEIGTDIDGYPIFGETKYFTTYEEANKYGYVPCDEEQDLSYPKFTSSKQLEIIKLIGNKLPVCFDFQESNPDFSQALAQLTTELMRAGEVDKEKVKEILEG